MNTFYVSFVAEYDDMPPKWLGGIYVKAKSAADAQGALILMKKWPTHFNGGNVMMLEIADGAVPQGMHDVFYHTTDELKAALRAHDIDDTLGRPDGTTL